MFKSFINWFNRQFVKQISLLEKEEGGAQTSDHTPHQKNKQKTSETRQRQTASRSTAPDTSFATTAQGVRSGKEVFVNNISSREIPKWVTNFLSLGSNFNLTAPMKFDKAEKAWSETKDQILSALERHYSKTSPEIWRPKTEKLLNKQAVYLNSNFTSSLCKLNRRYIKYNNKAKAVFDFIIANDLIVTPADKNLGLTISDATHYKYAMNEYIHACGGFKTHVQERYDIEDFESNIYVERMVSHWRSMMLALNYTTPEFDSLFEPYHLPHVKIPQIYGLWKLHKTPIKMRPIVPNFNWHTTKASKYLADKWQQFVDAIPWILPNSLELVRTFEHSYAFWIDEVYIASFDVNAMYPSIDYTIDEFWFLLKRAIKFAAKRVHVRFTQSYFESDFALLNWVLSNSFIQFNNVVYRQTAGLSMGSPVAPVVANLFLAGAEYNVFQHGLFKHTDIESSFTYRRYLDDIFITTQRMDKVHTFLNIVSGVCQPSVITFSDTNPEDRSKTVYLDLNIEVVDHGRLAKRLKFSPYDKPQNKHIYTNPNTFYPFRYIYNWLEGESIRLIRNSSNEKDFIFALDSFKRNLLTRDYNVDKVEYFISKRPYSDRPHLLKNIQRDDDNKSMRIFVKNMPHRPIITKLLHNFVLDFNSEFSPESPLTITPVIYKGRTILSTMNRARHIVLGDI